MKALSSSTSKNSAEKSAQAEKLFAKITGLQKAIKCQEKEKKALRAEVQAKTEAKKSADSEIVDLRKSLEKKSVDLSAKEGLILAKNAEIADFEAKLKNEEALSFENMQKVEELRGQV